MFTQRPHYKHAKSHRPKCRCYTCRIYRQQTKAAKALDILKEAENRNPGTET